MKRLMFLLPLTGLFAAIQGCVPQTAVELSNETDFTVEVQLFYDNDQELPKDAIQLTGTELNFTLEPGEVRRFERPCEELQAIFINDAEMLVAPGFSPETDTDVYREPDDFSCGDTMVFTFTAGPLNASLDISFNRVE